ncbi:hypothetical protein [Neptunicella sp. SCSIO 80796]|uniref:hypothetical protein n=1 Tax=Neptunicella plasticusilytica TaxID=3117012 RepID=UPI003A4E2657
MKKGMDAVGVADKTFTLRLLRAQAERIMALAQPIIFLGLRLYSTGSGQICLWSTGTAYSKGIASLINHLSLRSANNL